ncbi:hypothetical protein HMPREF0262_02324 [Clostridium sp. ATCC 29733]|nr:hypothetical protein HMPREF0262_02324 [Clostridium sp. ATCC 29733]
MSNAFWRLDFRKRIFSAAPRLPHLVGFCKYCCRMFYAITPEFYCFVVPKCRTPAAALFKGGGRAV